MKPKYDSLSTLKSIVLALGALCLNVQSSILITEVDNDIDYIEITNTSTSAIDISGWTLNIQDDGLTNWSFTLDAGSTLAAGESFGVSDASYFGAVVSTVNIPNIDTRGINAYVTDDDDILHDAISIVSGTDTGGTPLLNFPDFFGTIDWTVGDAVIRTANDRFTSDSFTIGAASPITATTLTGTSSATLSPIAGVVTVPEISSVCLLGLAGLSFSLRRKRMSR